MPDAQSTRCDVGDRLITVVAHHGERLSGLGLVGGEERREELAADGRRLDQHRLDLGLALHGAGGGDHARQQRADLAPPRPRHQRETEGSGRERLGRVVPDPGQRRHLVDERMPDMGDRYAVATVEVGLEREQDEHPVDELGDGADAPLAPGPDLRTDVVDDRNPEPLELAGEAQVELREVDQDGDRRTALLAGRDQTDPGSPWRAAGCRAPRRCRRPRSRGCRRRGRRPRPRAGRSRGRRPAGRDAGA